MQRFLLQFFHFSRAERAGSIALLVICGLVYLAPEVLHWFRPESATDFAGFQADVLAFRAGMHTGQATATTRPTGNLFAFDPNTATLEDFEHLGLSEKVAGIICNYRNKGGHFRQPDDLQKIYSLSAADFQRLRPWIRMDGGQPAKAGEESEPMASGKLFPFDPNLATEDELRRLGLSARTVKGILNYRNKGGKFRQPEDFGKIYTLNAVDFDRLAPYITIGAVTTASAERPVTYAGGGNYPEKKLVAKGPLDINRAGLEDWLRLPGIGEKRARQIINYRESLGGFLRLEQLAEMYGLPDSIFQKIRPMLVLEFHSIRPINLNTASVEELDRHPYISFKQATLIVNYRSQHGLYASADDISKIAAFTDQKWLEKIRPYLAVQ